LFRVYLTNKPSIPARNLSIWLLPGPNTPEYRGLGEIIDYLAHKHGNSPFPPHVTLSMLPFEFPLEVARDVVEEMKEEWFSKRIEFESIFTTTAGILVHGRRGNQTTRDAGGQPTRPPRDLLPGHDQERVPKGDQGFDMATSTVILQQRFHDRLQEEIQKRRLAGAIPPGTPDVRNIVPRFPHLSLAYTERGKEEGIKEIAEKGWYAESPRSNPDEAVGIELAGFKSYKVGAIFFAYCGGLKPEKWTIFERLEEDTVQGQGQGAVEEN
jgi:hypothetical protein